MMPTPSFGKLSSIPCHSFPRTDDPKALYLTTGHPIARRRRPVGTSVAFQPRQVAVQVGRGLVAQLAVLLQCLGNNALELGGHLSVQLPSRRGHSVQQAIYLRCRGLARKR